MDDCETFWIKNEQTDDVPNVPSSMFDPLGLSCCTDSIKEEPEVILEVDETKTIVVTSPRYENDNTRFIKNSDSCGIPYEEVLNQGVVHEQLDNGTDNSTYAPMCSTRIQELTPEEAIVFGTSLKCSSREREFQKFICNFCLQSFPSKYRLIMHVFKHIDNVQPPRYICKSCGEVFPNNVSLSNHLTITEDALSLSAGNEHIDSSRDCRNTSLEGDQDLTLMKPFNKQSSSKKTRKFSKTYFIDTHNITHKAENLDKHYNYGTRSRTFNVNVQAFQLTETRLHECDVCGRSFTRLNRLKSHKLLHVGVKPHKCDICGKSYTQSSTLKRHQFSHTGLKPFRCDICGKDFARLSHLRAHAIRHTGKRPHKCNVCGNSFTDSGTLRKHELLHTGMRPHICGICGKSFTLLGDLNRHSLIHIAKSRNTCEVCGESFTQLDDLKRHALMHNDTRPHICDVCGKRFAQLGALKRHILRHTGMKSHKCDICGKSFTEFDTLKRHSFLHTGEKPHKCDICGRAFIQFGNLKRHVLTHTGTRPYKCDVCDKSFIDLGTLKRHSLTHSRMKPHM